MGYTIAEKILMKHSGKKTIEPGEFINSETKETILNLLLEELEKTRQLMAELLGRSIKERRKNHYYSTRKILMLL